MISKEYYMTTHEILLILFSGGDIAQDIAIETNPKTGYMRMPIYRLN